MTVYTISTTAVQDAALALLVQDLNQQRAQLLTPLPPLTVPGYLLARMSDLLASYANDYAGRILQAAVARYPALSDADRSEILTLMGRPSFTALPLADQTAALAGLADQGFRQLSPDSQARILQLLGIV